MYLINGKSFTSFGGIKEWIFEKCSYASIESSKRLKAAGKPRQGPIFTKRQSCRLQYRKKNRDTQGQLLSSYLNYLHDAHKKMALIYGNIGILSLRISESAMKLQAVPMLI